MIAVGDETCICEKCGAVNYRIVQFCRQCSALNNVAKWSTSAVDIQAKSA